MRPDLRRIEFIKEEKGGYSKKYRVRDGSGREWVAKIGKEAQSETSAVRLLWSLGYVTEVNYLVPRVTIPGKGTFTNVRFEARPDNWKRGDEWKWKKNPFVGTPEFQGLKIMMALINTRNIHRSNMLMGFPYGKEFVYDEMVLTGAGEKGEANARLVMAANTEKTGPGAPKPGEGPSKEERENGLYDLLYVAIAPDGRQVRAAVKGDRDPGYGSTSKMISECAICLLRDTPDVPAGIWTPGAAMQHRLIKRLIDHAGLTFTVEN